MKLKLSLKIEFKSIAKMLKELGKATRLISNASIAIWLYSQHFY
jgi:hypothetical protein